MDEASISRVIDSAYASALAPGRMPELLGRLNRVFRSHFADSFTRSDDHSRHGGIVVGLDRADYEDVLLGTWSKRNVWGQRRPVKVAGEIITSSEIVPREELIRSEMYNEYLAPRGLHEGLRLAIWADGRTIEDISLLRAWTDGPFSRAELRLARHLLPHLQRAAAVARRLRIAEMQSGASFAALDALAHAVFLLDRAGRPLRMNRAAEALVAEGDGLVLAAAGAKGAGGGATLAGGTQSASNALAGLLQRAAGVAGERPLSGSLRLPRPSGRPDLILIGQPCDEAEDGLSPGERSVLLIATDPARSGLPQAWQLRQLYALTPMEADVALDLLGGLEVGEIARRRGRSVATIRTHVTRLLLKTGTARQVELVRLLLHIPRIDPG